MNNTDYYTRDDELKTERARLEASFPAITADSSVDDVLESRRIEERIAAIDTLLPLVEEAKRSKPVALSDGSSYRRIKSEVPESQRRAWSARMGQLEGMLSGKLPIPRTPAQIDLCSGIPDPSGRRGREIDEQNRKAVEAEYEGLRRKMLGEDEELPPAA